MKKYLLTLVVLLVSAMSASAFIDSYTVKREQLPEQAREMLDEHFPKAKISMIKVDRHLLKKTDYDVKLTNGVKIEFTNKGAWTSVKSGKKAIPEALVPKPIRNYVAKNFSTAHITGITKRNIGYDIILSDGSSHRFNLLHQYKGAISAHEAAADAEDEEA